MKNWVLLAALVVGSLWCGSAGLVSAMDGSIWVAVHGPMDGEPPEELVLEIGATAWAGYGGVASVESAEPLRVRVVGRASCRSYADFVAPADSNWVVRFAADGSVRVEDWTRRGMDAGPAVPEKAPSGCPAGVLSPQAPTQAPAAEQQQPPGPLVGPILIGVDIAGVLLVLGTAAIAVARGRKSRYG